MSEKLIIFVLLMMEYMISFINFYLINLTLNSETLNLVLKEQKYGFNSTHVSISQQLRVIFSLNMDCQKRKKKIRHGTDREASLLWFVRKTKLCLEIQK